MYTQLIWLSNIGAVLIFILLKLLGFFQHLSIENMRKRHIFASDNLIQAKTCTMWHSDENTIWRNVSKVMCSGFTIDMLFILTVTENLFVTCVVTWKHFADFVLKFTFCVIYAEQYFYSTEHVHCHFVSFVRFG